VLVSEVIAPSGFICLDCAKKAYTLLLDKQALPPHNELHNKFSQGDDNRWIHLHNSLIIDLGFSTLA
jgi:hypothetical protein